MVLVALFFIWELGCYLFISNPFLINILILVMLLPKYWSVALYPLVTLESSDEIRLSSTRKRDFYVSRFRIIFVVMAVLAVLAQIFVIGFAVLMVYLK
jgi:hypothetical protein